MQLEAKNVSFQYVNGPKILNNINISIGINEKVALVAPSGYGKSTLSKLLSGYTKPTEGKILFDGKSLPKSGYCPIQLIYQHPEKALNPLWKMRNVLKEGWEPDQKTLELLGIEDGWLDRYPQELSGGEMQRFCIARVLGPKTKFLIADEMTAMLDTITQAQIWQLMLQVVKERNLGLVVVTHNEALANKVCSKTIYLKELMEN